ncbi:cysteine hydrolase family protein [Flavobacterium enshiense]|uniref:cysteine hydrolase family protein n=1 Tax=Flavobacterium enshiense TaxID=1341165 RepID=UPI00345D4CC3
MSQQKDKTALILIDFQKGFDDITYWGGNRNNPDAEINAKKILDFFREHALPVFHVQHYSDNPKSRLAEGNEGHEIKDLLKPVHDEVLIKKNVNSAFIGTDLKDRLDADNITKLVIVGLTTDHCVSTTTRMAGNYGYETYLLSDATATFDKIGYDGKKYPAELIHETALASLHNEFANVLTTNEMIKKFMLGTS